VNKWRQFITNHPKTVIFLALGFLFTIVAITGAKFSEALVGAGFRLFGYLGFLLLFGTLYLLFIQGKQVILANLLLILNLVIVLEIVCFFLLGMPPAEKKDFSIPKLVPDHIGRQVGSVPFADSLHHHAMIQNGDTVFDVYYTIDEHAKRHTPGFDSTKNKHALFFGCSIAFGMGLEDDENISYYFQQESELYNSYNFSYLGFGTNHMLAWLQFQPLDVQIQEDEGVAFYVFFWDHIYRSIGTMSRYTDWLVTSPYYEIKDGKLVRNRLFKDGRYFTSKLYQLLYQSNIIRYFEIDFPMQLRRDHIDLVCEMILESKKEYQRQYAGSNFYCVFYPSFPAYTDEEWSYFVHGLTTRGIEYIDLKDVIEYGNEYTLNGDPHPNARTNALLGKELLKRLKQLND